MCFGGVTCKMIDIISEIIINMSLSMSVCLNKIFAYGNDSDPQYGCVYTHT